MKPKFTRRLFVRAHNARIAHIGIAIVKNLRSAHTSTKSAAAPRKTAV